MKIEADSNDIIEHPYDDKPSVGMFGLSDLFQSFFSLFDISVFHIMFVHLE